jgi:hypothetical protein
MRTIRCIVAAVNGDGAPDLFFVKVQCSEAAYDRGAHYEAAKQEAEREGYEPVLAYDEGDSAGAAMTVLFEWDTATVVTLADPPEGTCRSCGGRLTGHEDDSGTHCRWCVTCQPVDEGEVQNAVGT